MKVLFILASPDGELKRYFSTQKSAMIPTEIRNKYNAIYKLVAYDNSTDMDEFVLATVRANDDCAVVLLAHSSLALPSFHSFLPVQIFDDLDSSNPANFLSRVTSFWTKRISFLWKLFADMQYQKVFLLPDKNFVASELDDLNNTLPTRLPDASYDIGPSVEASVSALRQRQRPAARGRAQQRYFVDDRGYFFEYGHEVHARPQTSGDAHISACEVNSLVRYGMPYSTLRHFNVTRGTGISKGDFRDCHGGSCTVERQSHLNIFPNNYIE